jgi:two-component system, OmpR family, KDP operon response regulator KdpE
MGDFILIIDDEPDICKLLQLSLLRRGYIVKYVHALEEGMKCIRDKRPDILFLDIHLPDGSGLEALPAIKKQCPETPIVTISAYDTGMEMEQALSAGASYFLPKPFSLKRLQEVIYQIKS